MGLVPLALDAQVLRCNKWK